MKQKGQFLDTEYETRFVKASNEDIPDVDIVHFTRTFESAWHQRRWYHRLAAKPLVSMMLAGILLLSALGAGYSLVLSNDQEPESVSMAPILMPGQRMVEQPELLSLFPKVDEPTIISMKPENKQSKQTYLVHGYLADNQVQVVWEY